MERNTGLIIGIILIVAIIIGFGFWIWRSEPQGQGDGIPLHTGKTKTYSSSKFPLSFSYPSNYFVIERDESTGARNQYSIVLAEDTEEHRRVFAGEEPGREAPPTITIQIFQNNLDHSAAESWIRGTHNSNFKLSDGNLSSTTIGNEEGLSYHATGLYENDNVVVARPDNVYMFTVFYLSQDDQIKKDFSDILHTVKFVRPATQMLFKFEDYPVTSIFSGTPAAVNFTSDERAKTFQTAIVNGAKDGPNVAGKYTIVEWGCGTSCQSHAIIDTQTGAIVEYGLGSSLGLDYKKESKLLIVNPPKNLGELETIPEGIEIDYYILDNGKLDFLAKQRPGESEAEVCAQVITRAKNPATGEIIDFPDPCHVPFGWNPVH